MAYQAWSVVAFEVPTAAKWNILGSNDSSFNDGSGIAAMDHAVTSVTNPYLFDVIAGSNTSGLTTTVYSAVELNTEQLDPNNDFSSSAYIVPVTGYYFLAAGISLYNGVGGLQGGRIRIRANDSATILEGYPLYDNEWSCDLLDRNISGIVLLAAGNSLKVEGYASYTSGTTLIAASSGTYFCGHLISR